MLTIKIPKAEYWDERTNTFLYHDEISLTLEHSLVSVSRWESRYHKTFLSKQKKTSEEMLYYIKCMTIKCTDDSAYLLLTENNQREINDYIQDPMSACYFDENSLRRGGSSSNEPMTSELIYYMMFSCGIPKECEKWHLNRLLSLLKVFQIKNNNSKGKRNLTRSQLVDRARLNEARKAKLHSPG